MKLNFYSAFFRYTANLEVIAAY